MRSLSAPLVAAVAVLVGHPAFLLAGQNTSTVVGFQQLDDLLPAPGPQRTASGAPGPEYWQQQADYDIDVELDEPNRRIVGSARVTYHNNSPHTLAYLWLQLDRNVFARHSTGNRSVSTAWSARTSFRDFEHALTRETFDGGFEHLRVTDPDGNSLSHTINDTMMRVDLPAPLAPGGTFTFAVAWEFPINDARTVGTRTGFETFGDDRDGAHAVYCIAQWYPRLAAYTDYGGWQIKPYLATSEFALEFGNFTVRLTVPDDHVVAATGTLQNPEDVLSSEQRERLTQAETSRTPVFIVTPDEARAAESGKPRGRKTWVYHAEKVRDFAFASSRSFIWDAMGVPGQTHRGRPVMAMSLYPREGQPLWDRYATHAVAHAITVYSQYTFPYPYPVAITVLGAVPGGMEYPMICFNGPRPEKDGTYPRSEKDILIRILIHEVGHNYFPMIVNSDERQWFWLDEGINSVLDRRASRAWQEDFGFTRERYDEVVAYLRRTDRVPVMTAADSVIDLGENAYDQPAAALQILREVVLGRERFDFAFRTYAQRWMFKRPTPADFFRTMEDASGVDLDWFWRSWFFSTDRVDVAVERVRWLQLDSRDPAVEKPRRRERRDERPKTLAEQRDAGMRTRVDEFPELKDFYNAYDEFAVTAKDREDYEKLLRELREADINPALLKTEDNLFLIDFRNLGGMITPLPLRIEYTDGTSEELYLPAEIWRTNTEIATKLIVTPKVIGAVVFDPREELTDTNVENNHWPRRLEKTPFQLEPPEKDENPMRAAREAEKQKDSAR